MKVALLIAILCISALAGSFEYSNGDDVLKNLQEGSNDVFVILFHAGSNKGEALTKKTNEYQLALRGIQEKYPEFKYATIDASDRKFDSLIDAISLIRGELEKSPSVLIMHKGNGEWIHGPQTISKIINFAPAYKERMANSQ